MKKNYFALPDFSKASNHIRETWERKIPLAVASLGELHFKNSFRNQGFTDKALIKWDKTVSKKKNKTILVKDSNLKKSVKVIEKSKGVVIIEAGSDIVPYAQIHNEGGIIKRKLKKKKNSPKKKSILEKKTSSLIKMPKRQFMGNSEVLNKKINENINTKIKELENLIFSNQKIK